MTMGKKDPRVDAYIEHAPDFARPVLKHLRAVVHAACPDVEETLKWRTPSFMYHGLMCGMAAFKARCMFGFWKGSLIVGPDGRPAKVGMGELGEITALADLPPKRLLVAYVQQAMKLNEGGVKNPRPAPKPKKPLRSPAYLTTALKKNKKAEAAFKSFSPSHKREYIEWLTDAKSEETRARRLATALEWMAAGKPRNWQYM